MIRKKLINQLFVSFTSFFSREKTYEADELVYVTDKSQKDHFDGVFSCLDALGHRKVWKSSRLNEYINFKLRFMTFSCIKDKVSYMKTLKESLLKNAATLDLVKYLGYRPAEVLEQVLVTSLNKQFHINITKPNYTKSEFRIILKNKTNWT